MKTETDLGINPDTHLRENAVSGCTGHFLTEAVNALTYKTPQKIIDYIEKHKHDYLIQNPPYDAKGTR